MVGAVACLSAYSGMGVVVHGSSGCWFYPSSLLKIDLGCTDLSAEDAILGTGDRVRAVVEAALTRNPHVAVVNTCVPGIIGEDFIGLFDGLSVTVVDAPGFLGGAPVGHKAAIAALEPVVDPEVESIGIDGLSPLDPFFRGDLHETERLLRLAGAEPGTRYAGGPVTSVQRASPVTVVANPAYAAGPGLRAGDLMGLEAVRATFNRLADLDPRIDPTPIEDECLETEDRCRRAGNRFLARHDPPRVAVFGDGARVRAAARTLERYLDADCVLLGDRGDPAGSDRSRWCRADDLGPVEEALSAAGPDLVLGSSFEERLAPGAAFVPFGPPVRGRPRLASVPLCGIEGTLALVEAVLIACAGRRKT